MRKINNILVHIMIALFLLHALMGSLIVLFISDHYILHTIAGINDMKNKAIIIGAGAAGLSAALELAKDNISSIIISDMPSERAPSIIQMLFEKGMSFTLSDSGVPDVRAFGGQSVKRTFYAASNTGKQLMYRLIAKEVQTK